MITWNPQSSPYNMGMFGFKKILGQMTCKELSNAFLNCLRKCVRKGLAELIQLENLPP